MSVFWHLVLEGLHGALANALAGMSGFSMGGVHACMATSLYPFPIACTPLLAPRSAAVAYCQGALHRATAWRSLLVSKDEKQQVGTVSRPEG